MWSRVLSLLPQLPLYSCWVVLHSFSVVLYSCCLVLYSFVSYCTRVVLVLSRVVLVLSCVVSCCLLLYSCRVVLSRVVTRVVCLSGMPLQCDLFRKTSRIEVGVSHLKLIYCIYAGIHIFQRWRQLDILGKPDGWYKTGWSL